jgi:hypothetical protein
MIAEFTKYGTTGIAIAAIFALFWISKSIIELMKNHISHNTKALEDLCIIISELKEIIKNRKK